MDYVLITPARNEEAGIARTRECMVAQTRPPLKWVIVDDGSGGPVGLVSISGVKFTTARLVAVRALGTLVPAAHAAVPTNGRRPPPVAIPTPTEFRTLLQTDPSRALALAGELARTEAVIRLDDLLLRRTDWGILPDPAGALAERLADVVGRAASPLR